MTKKCILCLKEAVSFFQQKRLCKKHFNIVKKVYRVFEWDKINSEEEQNGT